MVQVLQLYGVAGQDMCTKPIFQESIVVKEFQDFGFWRKADEFYWLNKIEKEK